MKAVFQEFQKQQMEQQQQKMQQMAAPNEAAGQQYMEQQMQANPNLKKTASGLVYEAIKEGSGKKPTIDNVVKVNYTGTTIDGQVFDSTEGKDPAVFPLNGVIPGWTEGLQLMSVGSTYRLIIPAALAYGSNPPPGTPIQPGSTLVFTVELLSIEK
jgi:FKBP-type peptidyl-prolyl cis-trans isomerase